MRYTDEYVVLSFLPKVKETTENNMLEDNAIAVQVPLVERLRDGFPMKEFRLLQELLQIPEDELGRYLGVSPATLHRRKKSGRLETPESERVVRFARLFGIIMDVFQTKEATREWLKTSNPGTAGESPLNYSDTEFGAREVEHLIGRIEHGIFN